MYVRRPLFRQPQRRGFTLIELLVVISIIATLAALVLPAIQNARATARRTQCTNNIRNINVAIQAYATSHGGKIPRLTDSKNQISYGTTLLASGTTLPAGWAVSLLPYMEQVTLYDRLRQSVNPTATDTSPNSTNGLALTPIKAFICPDNPNGGAGSMSYVANAGYIDSTLWSTTGDQLHSTTIYDFDFNNSPSAVKNNDDAQVAYGSGVFWRDQDTTIDQISSGDGTSQTVFLSENLNVGKYVAGTYEGGWISPYTGDIAFGARIRSTYATGTSTVTPASSAGGIGVEGASGTNKSQGLILSGTDQGGGFETPSTELSKINHNVAGATDSASPRPSSLHPGVVNMAFGDGAVKVVSQDIDDTVYLRLLTPFGGRRHGQNVLADTDF